MANILNAWYVDNTVTADPNDKILILQSPGKAGMDKIYEEMRKEDTGLRPETLVHVTTLFQRNVARLLTEGWLVNTDLFQAQARFTGVLEDGKWNAAKNGIHISFRQDKFLREEIAKTQVTILGPKADLMYISGTEDIKTGKRDGTVTPGRNLRITGNFLRVAGTDEAVGITLRNLATNASVKLDADMIALNNPSELMLLIPADLADGNYELTITTQFTTGKNILKVPRSASTSLLVGNGGGDEGGDDIL